MPLPSAHSPVLGHYETSQQHPQSDFHTLRKLRNAQKENEWMKRMRGKQDVDAQKYRPEMYSDSQPTEKEKKPIRPFLDIQHSPPKPKKHIHKESTTQQSKQITNSKLDIAPEYYSGGFFQVSERYIPEKTTNPFKTTLENRVGGTLDDEKPVRVSIPHRIIAAPRKIKVSKRSEYNAGDSIRFQDHLQGGCSKHTRDHRDLERVDYAEISWNKAILAGRDGDNHEQILAKYDSRLYT